MLAHPANPDEFGNLKSNLAYRKKTNPSTSVVMIGHLRINSPYFTTFLLERVLRKNNDTPSS